MVGETYRVVSGCGGGTSGVDLFFVAKLNSHVGGVLVVGFRGSGEKGRYGWKVSGFHLGNFDFEFEHFFLVDRRVRIS